MKRLSEEQKARQIKHFKKIIRYRYVFGWVISVVGISLCFVGMKNLNDLLIIINGILFLGWGLFMVWQSKNAGAKLSKPE